jgi:hypothetical protein
MYPYCRHLRWLDLKDFGDLLDDDKFRGEISKHLFSDELARFHFTIATQTRIRAERLDRNKIVAAVGDEITQRAPLLEAITEPTLLDTLSTALLTWAPRLPNLRELGLFNGKALADETVRNLLHAHCPNLDSITLYHSSSTETDNALATFISGMPENRLTRLEILGDCGVGAETCLALNNHRESLRELRLSLDEQGILALGLLKECTEITTLAIGAERTTVDLKATQNDVYLEIIDWLKDCNRLKNVTFRNVVSAPDLLIPILQNKSVELNSLEINTTKDDNMYVVKDHHDFHRALAQQTSLSSLLLRADPDPGARDDVETLVNTLCSLSGLRDLKLIQISYWFNEQHISLLGKHLSDLESLYVGGYGITDNVFPAVAKMKKLKALNFSGMTSFTTEGVADFIETLGPGNAGLQLNVENADQESALSEDEQNLLNELIQVKVDGRFEYQLFRGEFLLAIDDNVFR